MQQTIRNSDKISDEDMERKLKEEYTGCCVCHVRKGAKIVASLGLLLDVILVFLSYTVIIIRLTDSEHNQNSTETKQTGNYKPIQTWDWLTTIGVAALSTIGIIVHGLIVYGVKSKKSWPFIPYLILKPIEILVLILAVLGLSASWINSVTIISGANHDKPTADANALVWVIIVKVWFCLIIAQAYRYYRKL